MKYVLNTKDCTCARCNRPLADEKRFMTNGSSFLCVHCMDCFRMGEYYTYLNTNDGHAVLLLDRTTHERLVSRLRNAVKSEKVTILDAPLAAVDTDEKAVVIIELYDKKERPYPQQQMMDADSELAGFVREAQASDEQIVVKDSRVSGKTYLFYKADSQHQCYDSFYLIAEKLRNMSHYTRFKSTVYMQRCIYDLRNYAVLLLGDCGYKCVYCTGNAKGSERMIRRVFPIDFTMEELYNYCRSRIIGQDKELLKAVFLVYRFLENTSTGSETPAVNWMLTAPSGMGKTEFFRCVRDFFKEHNVPVPVIQYDLSQVTEAGYKGKEITSILSAIFEARPQNNKLPSGTAICFLDEADKKFCESIDSRGRDGNANAQANLLTMVEGSVMTANDDDEEVNTSKTMFVFLGAFQELRDKKQENAEALYRIFHDEDEAAENMEDLYSDISLEDMISNGMLEEIAGRISMVIHFRRLPEEDMRRLIRTKAELAGREFGVNVRLTAQAEDDLLKLAYTNLGIRKPVNKLRELIFVQMAERSLQSGGFDSAREEVVILSKDNAEIRCKCKEDAA